MSELGLLVTGILKTGQPSLPNLLEQQPFHSANDVQNFIHNQLSGLVITAQITPPEFILTDSSSPTIPSALKVTNENTLGLLAKSNYSESLVAVRRRAIRTNFQTFSSQPLPILSFGSSGTIVRVLQRLLISSGYGMPVDGIFGPFTEAAVKAFQNQRKLTPDGIVGQRTWRELTF
jgi:hypothetical protein